MTKIEFYKRIEIETSDDMMFSVQATKTQLIDADGTHNGQAGIVLLIEDEEGHREMATFLSADDTDSLITKLKDLNEKVKEYNKKL